MKQYTKIFIITITSVMSGIAAELTKEVSNPMENQPRFYAIVDDGLDEGKRANAIAHMSLGLGSALGADKIGALPYETKDSLRFNNISQYPFIVLKGNSSKIKALYEEITADGTIPHVEFLDTMHLGPTYIEQIEATKAITRNDIRILGIVVFGTVGKLKPVTKRFSLLK